MHIDRRAFLASAGVGAAAALAGCFGGPDAPDPEGDAVEELPTPVLGDPDAGTTVQVFEDFACPTCREFKRQLFPPLREEYVDPGEIRYEHRDFPIPVDDRWSWAVGGAARAVQDEAGNDAFWAFANAIYDHQSDYSLDAIESVADEVADVGEAARDAADGNTYVGVLEADREYGSDNGVNGTPTVFVDGEEVDLDFEAIAAAIES